MAGGAGGQPAAAARTAAKPAPHRAWLGPPLALVLVVCRIVLGGERGAIADPSDRRLLLVGAGLAVPTYAIGVTLHEGSHALAAKLVGAEVLSINLLPGRDPATGAFHFGLTRVRGLSSRGEKVFFYVAPKLTDAVLLAGFTGLVLSDGWPRNRYGQLTLTVLATGVWIDFAKDAASFSPFNDVVKVMNLFELRTEWRRLPVRLGYATVAVALAFAVARGYQRTFGSDELTGTAAAFALPLLRGRF